MKRILVIEDDDTLREFIVEMLNFNGYKTFDSRDGLEGINILRTKGADLVILDIMMPHISGFEVLKELRKDPPDTAVPIILLTGMTDRADFRKGMELGADDFISKPFKEEELMASVAAQLKKRDDLFSLNHETGSTAFAKKLDMNDQLLFNIEGQPKLLKISSLKCIMALGDYSNVITSDGKFIIRKPMKEWEGMLPSKNFVRIHRSTIINLEYIEKIERFLNRGYKVYIRNINKPFIISRRYRGKIRERFG